MTRWLAALFLSPFLLPHAMASCTTTCQQTNRMVAELSSTVRTMLSSVDHKLDVLVAAAIPRPPPAPVLPPPSPQWPPAPHGPAGWDRAVSLWTAYEGALVASVCLFACCCGFRDRAPPRNVY